MLKKNFAVLGLALCACSAFANDAVAPYEIVEGGKLKRISIHTLTPKVKQLVQEDLNQDAFAKVRVYGSIPDDAVIYRKNYHARVKDMKEISKNVTFKLADVSGGRFDGLALEGAYPEGPTKSGPWSSLTRVFKRSDGVLVMLHEWDYSGDGGGITFVDELMNTKVVDVPARLSVNKSPSGQVVSELMWATKKKFFTLTVLDDVPNTEASAYNIAWLTKLASDIK
jgi:hypothetical protein